MASSVHNYDNEDNDDNDNDSKWLETSLGAFMQKQSLKYTSTCFICNKRGRKSANCPDKKKKGRSEKASAVTETSAKNPWSNCGCCSIAGHAEHICWKKYKHKAPCKSSTEASRVFLDEELILCNIKVDDTFYLTEDVENACYSIPTNDDGQLEDFESWMGLPDLLKA